MITINVNHHCRLDDELRARLDQLAQTITNLEDFVMTTQAELTATLGQVLAQQQKTAAEIAAVQAGVDTLKGTIEALEKQLAAGSVTPELEAAVAAVKAQAQIVDDLIPD